MRRSLFMLGVLALILPLVFLGCGDDGTNGSPGTSVGTISGTVTNSTSGAPVSGATVSTTPNQGTATTAADGTYSLSDLPAGVYEIGFSATGYASPSATTVSVLAGVTSTLNQALTQTQNVVVNVAVTGSATPGATLTATATPTVIDGSSVTGITWSQKNSVTVTFDNTTNPTTNVTLPDLAAYKDELITVLAEPPAGGTLPAGVPIPPVEEAEYSGGLQNRTYNVAINPHALEEAGLITLVATVHTTSGDYEGEGEISTTLPWPSTTGINNVPVNVPVILHGWVGDNVLAPQTTWDWTITGGAAFDNATSQNPSFTPTAAGVYTVTEAVSGVSFDIVAGTWVGLITGEGPDGRPVGANCFPACHTGANAIVNDEYLAWRETGHAEIFKDNMDNPAGHWSLSCAPCHGVGYDTAAVNNGWDEAMASEGWTVPHPGPGTYASILVNYPDVAQLSNIQCENCHGPNNSAAHNTGTGFDPARFSLSSDLCGSCHGEPARHGRYQQWQLSLHADYDLAIREGDSTSCSRCHTGNGFLAWGEYYDWAGGQNLAAGDITWDDNTVHPQTCATCHDPHSIGTTTGEPTNAKVRISGDTPVLDAGWQAFGVGRGAICMVCHNQRRGLTNDDWSLGVQGVPMPQAREPHHGPQSDMLMGQSAFFINVGTPGAHARVPDTCVGCHMEKTPPPALLSYSLGGTNHTFYAAPNICSQCHASIQNSATVKNNTLGQLELIGNLMGPATAEQITAIINSGDNVILRTSTDNVTLTAPITGSDFVDGEFTITAGGVTYTGVGYDDLYVNAISNPNRFALASEETQILIKASWNYVIVVDDKSGGVHNPSFVATMLANTFDVVRNTDFAVRTPLGP